uniref:Uncharacterized protein n=1 Tax=Anopheles albimanus TaxID=7167 RepID=A0A182FZ50_ANOAL
MGLSRWFDCSRCCIRQLG